MTPLLDRIHVWREDRKARRRKRHAERHVRHAHKLGADAEARRSDTVGRGGGGDSVGGSLGGF